MPESIDIHTSWATASFLLILYLSLFLSDMSAEELRSPNHFLCHNLASASKYRNNIMARNLDPAIGAHIPEVLKEQLEIFAIQRGKTRSEIIKRALRLYLTQMLLLELPCVVLEELERYTSENGLTTSEVLEKVLVNFLGIK